jgi:hypothetical protein
MDAGNFEDAHIPLGQTNYKGVCGANWGADETQHLESIDTLWESVASLQGIVIDAVSVFPYFSGLKFIKEDGHVGTGGVPGGFYRGNHSC